jgi:GntR family transcriptional regulator
VGLFRFVPQSGVPIADQVIFAAKKAIFSGALRPGDAFPSVRTLAREMKKVIGQLASEGFLQVMPGIGTIVARPPARNGRVRLMGRELEQLAIQALQLGVSLDDLQDALRDCWAKVAGKEGGTE